MNIDELLTKLQYNKSQIETGHNVVRNQFEALEEIDPVIDKIDTYSDKIVKSLISIDLSDLAKKYSEANKKKLIVNLEKRIRIKRVGKRKPI